jgi:hypothetical protein
VTGKTPMPDDDWDHPVNWEPEAAASADPWADEGEGEPWEAGHAYVENQEACEAAAKIAEHHAKEAVAAARVARDHADRAFAFMAVAGLLVAFNLVIMFTRG